MSSIVEHNAIANENFEKHWKAVSLRYPWKLWKKSTTGEMRRKSTSQWNIFKFVEYFLLLDIKRASKIRMGTVPLWVDNIHCDEGKLYALC